MDFGEVLDEWDRIKREREVSPQPPEGKKAAAGEPASAKSAAKKTAAKKTATRALEEWLSANDVRDKDQEPEGGLCVAERNRESRRLSDLRPQASLDLHGMTGDEAESAIADFLRSAHRMGLEKVLVIHGKGLHSAGAPVLKKVARRSIETEPLAGRFGAADKADGGSGALWVLMKKRG